MQVACRVLGVSESGFYERRDRAPSERAVRHAMLTDLITAGPRRRRTAPTAPAGCTPSSPSAAASLVGHNAVEMLMRRAGIQGVTGRPQLEAAHARTLIATDLVDRDFARDGPNQLWVTDITEHPTREGKVYCAVVLDTYSRRVVGWSIDASPTAALVTNALGMAIDARTPSRDRAR